MWCKVGRAALLTAALVAVGVAVAACGSSSGSGTAIAVGDSVAAMWTDGSYYLATVTAVDGDSVTVTYVDDGTSKTLKAGDVRAIPTKTYAVGDRVLAVWSSGRFYAGEVTKVDGDAYTVKWDDGSTPSTVEVTKIVAE